jgi:hypothetical protein
MWSDAQELLNDAASREPPDLVRLSIRDLLELWGHKRRGYWIVSRIERDLEEAGLVTAPSFTQGWIDASLTLVPKTLLKLEDIETPDGLVSPPGQEGATEPGEVTILVGSLRSAGQGVSSVNPDATLLEAQSLMMRNDYSQLAVMSGPRNLRGAVAWESIAQASMRSSSPVSPTASSSLKWSDSKTTSSTTFRASSKPVTSSCNPKNATISGIMTTADLSEELQGWRLPSS